MKNYASVRAGKGRTAYRTPSVFKYQKVKKMEKAKNRSNREYSNSPKYTNGYNSPPASA